MNGHSRAIATTDGIRRGNYGIDSLSVVATLLLLGVAGLLGAWLSNGSFRILATALGLYLIVAGLAMVYYSKWGKLALRERLLSKLNWGGEERVLDVGCGRGLLTVAVARRLSSGKVVGVDVWKSVAITGNEPASVLKNALIEGVTDRVEVEDGDARALPFPDASFDVVVSNYVVHDLKDRQERQQMMREVARVLKPGGRVALVDFAFTRQCVADLRRFGISAGRARDARLPFWMTAILHFGFAHTYLVLGTKPRRAG